MVVDIFLLEVCAKCHGYLLLKDEFRLDMHGIKFRYH
jgi:hypothetical protein